MTHDKDTSEPQTLAQKLADDESHRRRETENRHYREGK